MVKAWSNDHGQSKVKTKTNHGQPCFDHAISRNIIQMTTVKPWSSTVTIALIETMVDHGLAMVPDFKTRSTMDKVRSKHGQGMVDRGHLTMVDHGYTMVDHGLAMVLSQG